MSHRTYHEQKEQIKAPSLAVQVSTVQIIEVEPSEPSELNNHIRRQENNYETKLPTQTMTGSNQ